ncbi:MAG TPA: hypothetical protein VNT75_23275 [Symbiobacteriaceae bacterium]|nr:hypothetical protein [Symbiobacteriaceae bacterium]
MSILKRMLMLVVAAALMGACTKGSPPQKDEPKSVPVTPAAPAEKADGLFPGADLRLVYSVTDQGQPAVAVDEDWLRDGDRIVATYNGTPYVTWLLRSDGVWRADPGGSGVLLRYLPPELQDGTVWKQTSGGQDIWFKLTRESSQWLLQVVNRAEVTLFRFSPAAGPYRVESINYANPSHSFVKQQLSSSPGKVEAGTRAAHLKNMPSPALQAAPVTAATLQEFAEALNRVTQTKPAP